MSVELRRLCERLARLGGDIAREGRIAGLSADTKSSATDLVTEFDRAAESAIVAVLNAERPDDAIIGEEGTSKEGTSGYAWHLDPIDGTTNYVYDQPAWGCSVAVDDEGTMVAGAVAVPVLAELYSAHLHGGATCNGAPIRVSDRDQLDLALVATGFSYQADRRARQAEVLADVLPQVRDIRRLGSAAVDLCMVACGRVDAYFEWYLNSWDAAAGELIAREAGAMSTDYTGAEPSPAELVVATPGVHSALIDLLRVHTREVHATSG